MRPDDLLTGALREFHEETGLDRAGAVRAAPPVRQKSGKTVHGFAFEADLDLTNFSSNTFEMEWPPRSGRQKQFPEIDRIGWFGADEAMKKIIAYQRPFLVELQEKLGGTKSPPPVHAGERRIRRSGVSAYALTSCRWNAT